MLNDLIKIADALDEKGLHKEADFVDSMLIKSARARAVQDFIDQLKKAFQNVSPTSRAFPNIRKSLPEILRLIDITAGYREYQQPSVTEKTLQEIQNPDRILVENVAALQDDIEDIQKEMKTETDQEKLKDLQFELQDLTKRLKVQFEKVVALRDSTREEDKEKFKEFVRQYDEKRRQRIVRQQHIKM